MRPERLILTSLLALLPAAGCCVTPPDAAEILDSGFRTPEMTLHTFQLGVRGDLARLEYRCFGVGFIERNHLSQLAYREWRERNLASNPWFQKGVADAEILRSESLGEGRQLLVAGTHGYFFEVEFVREDFWQLWSGDTLLADDQLAPGGFRRQTDLLEEVAGPPIVVASVELPSALAALPLAELRSEMTEFRVGREWKIDRIQETKSPRETPTTPVPTPIEP